LILEGQMHKAASGAVNELTEKQQGGEGRKKMNVRTTKEKMVGSRSGVETRSQSTAETGNATTEETEGDA
jgi:hypothetical protein